MDKIVEFRGISNLTAAQLITDTAATLAYGTPFPVAGVAELSKSVETSTDVHYYDNLPAVAISGVGKDETTVNTSVIPEDVTAQLTGQTYITDLGTLVEGNPTFPYLAVGYVTEDTDGNERWVWRLKTKCSIPTETHKTKDDGTEADGQEITLTGINTTHGFTELGGKTAKALVYDPSKNLITKENFFASVQTPDTLRALVPATQQTEQTQQNGGG